MRGKWLIRYRNMDVTKVNPVDSIIKPKDRRPQPQVWDKPKMRDDVQVDIKIVNKDSVLDILV